MDRKVICLDTSILIDYFRKKKKGKSIFMELAKNYDFAVSVITKMEISVGAMPEQIEFWQKIFSKMLIIPLSEKEIDNASEIIKKLRNVNKMIDLADILIGATAITNNLELATFNTKHFIRIENLSLISNFY